MSIFDMLGIDVGDDRPSSDDQVLSSNLAGREAYRAAPLGDISYKDARTGERVYIEPSDQKNYRAAFEELSPEQRREASYQMERRMEQIVAKGEQATAAAALEQAEVDPADPGRFGESDTGSELYGESLTFLGERQAATDQQNMLNEKLKQLLPSLNEAKAEYQRSLSAKKRFDEGDQSQQTLAQMGLLQERKANIEVLEAEVDQLQSGLTLEESRMDPSRAKFVLEFHLGDLIKNQERLDQEVLDIKNALSGIASQEQEGLGIVGRSIPFAQDVFGKKDDEHPLVLYQRKSELEKMLRDNKDEAFQNNIRIREHQKEQGNIGETVPLQDQEMAEILNAEFRLTEAEHRARYPEAYTGRVGDAFPEYRFEKPKEQSVEEEESAAVSVDPKDTGSPIVTPG